MLFRWLGQARPGLPELPNWAQGTRVCLRVCVYLVLLFILLCTHTLTLVCEAEVVFEHV